MAMTTLEKQLREGIRTDHRRKKTKMKLNNEAFARFLNTCESAPEPNKTLRDAKAYTDAHTSSLTP